MYNGCWEPCTRLAYMLRNSFARIVFASRLAVYAALAGGGLQVALCQAADEGFDRVVRPLLTHYCVRCHGGKEPKAEFDLEALREQGSILNDRAAWEKVLEHLRNGAMPPEGEVQPPAAQRELVADWLDERFKAADCAAGPRPGRVTIRRLNRAEYNNTIRDLVGIDFRPADDFPADDTGYGFDNIGDVLSLPPLLLEKYLAAAEKIAEQAIVLPKIEGQKRRFEAESIDRTEGGPFAGWAIDLFSQGEVYAQHEFQAGEYVLRARAFGEQAGNEPARMMLRLDGKDVKLFDVKAVEGIPENYECRLTVEAGAKRFAAAFVNDYYRPDDPDPNNRDRNLVIDYLEVEGPLPTAAPDLPESHKRILFCLPSGGDEMQCAERIIAAFASRAFRRPTAPDEVQRLLGLVQLAKDSGESFEQGIRLAVQAVLVSPHFLFRVEQDRQPDRPDGSYALGDFDLATRLSYFLWSSTPDAELLDVASRSMLHEGHNLEKQVRRMLRDGKRRALVENFAGQWLQLRNLQKATPDPGRYPAFDEPLRQAMRTETESFFAAVVEEDRSVLDFLDADFTFVNERLARHYGLEGVQGNEFQRVHLPDGRRGGVLTQASILTITSNATRTSPVKRGKWVLENLLGTPPPPPPPNVPELAEGDKAALSGTLRQRMEQHRKNALCASCHSRMDPLGFGLENFDGIGAWRSDDGGQPIDASGTLPSGEKFQGPAELRGVLKGKQELFIRCLAEKMLTYALGRGLEPYDRCAVDKIQAAMAADGNKFSRMIVEIVASDAFRRRSQQQEN